MFNYVIDTLDTGDIAVALAQAEANAAVNLSLASQRRETDVAVIERPEPTPVVGSDEVSLRFSRYNTLPAWDNAVNDFVAQDAQIGQIRSQTVGMKR
ncbi:MAG: hypothetical protein U0694_06405 [Anaerolineae bacterium]